MSTFYHDTSIYLSTIPFDYTRHVYTIQYIRIEYRKEAPHITYALRILCKELPDIIHELNRFLHSGKVPSTSMFSMRGASIPYTMTRLLANAKLCKRLSANASLHRYEETQDERREYGGGGCCCCCGLTLNRRLYAQCAETIFAQVGQRDENLGHH